MSKGIRIITETEHLVHGDFAADGYEIYFRRIPSHIRNRIAKKYTRIAKRGVEVTDWLAASIEMLEYSILGWRGVYSVENEKDVEIEYSSDMVEWLPDEIQTDVLEKSGANITKDGGESKNLPTTRANKSQTTE